MNERHEFDIYVGNVEYGTFISLEIAKEVANKIKKETTWPVVIYEYVDPEQYITHKC